MDDMKIHGLEANLATKSFLTLTIPRNPESLFKSATEKVHVQDSLHHVMRIKSSGHLGARMQAAKDLDLQIGVAKRVDFCSRLPTATDLPCDLYYSLGITNLFPDIADYLAIAGVYQSSQV